MDGGPVAAWAAKATLWPFGIFLALFVAVPLAGWVITRERGDSRDDSPGSPHSWLTSRQ
jgi:cytochrome b561